MDDQANKIEGKPQARSPHDQAQRIQASRMSKIYDSLEILVTVPQANLDLGDLAALVANPNVTVQRGELFKNHKRAHNMTIVADEIVRARFNDVDNPEITVGELGSTYDTEDKLEVESVFVTTTVNPTLLRVQAF